MVDLAKYAAPPETAKGLERVAEMARRQKQAMAKVEQLEELLKEAKSELRDIREKEFPEVMNEFGLTSVKTEDGLLVEVKREVSAQLSSAKAPAAIAWMTEHGRGSLIKKSIQLLFDRDEIEEAEEAERNIRSLGFQPKITETVAPQTLKKFVRDLIAEGEDFPRELFNVYEYDITKVKEA